MTDQETKNLQSPFTLSGLVEYNPGAIVSRAIKKSDEGNITLFAFSEGENLSPHSAPFDALLQVLEGRLDVSIGDKEHEMKSGDAVLLPADIPHAVVAKENTKMLLTMVKSK